MQKNFSITRIDWIDFAKGVAIILMVLGHTSPRGDLQNFIYVFHMPFFFVMAGFLLNLNKWGDAENFKPFVTKLFKRLLVPYFIAEILWYPVWFVFCYESTFWVPLFPWIQINPFDAFLAIFKGSGIEWILLPLWFLPCLLLAEMIFVKLYNLFNEGDREIFVLAVAIISCIGFNLSYLGIVPFRFNVAFVAQFFFVGGRLDSEIQFCRTNNFKGL